MALFALRRLVLAIPLLLGITFISFLVIQLAPGGPFDYLRSENTIQDPKLVERLKSSFDFCSTVLAKLDDSKLDETLTLFGERKATRAAAILMLAGSWGDHYSLQSTYLRLNGQLPPTAKK